MVGRRVLLAVLATDTIDEVKAKIQAANIPAKIDEVKVIPPVFESGEGGLLPGLPPGLQRISFQGTSLEGSLTLAHYRVQHYSTVKLRWSHNEQETYDTAD